MILRTTFKMANISLLNLSSMHSWKEYMLYISQPLTFQDDTPHNLKNGKHTKVSWIYPKHIPEKNIYYTYHIPLFSRMIRRTTLNGNYIKVPLRYPGREYMKSPFVRYVPRAHSCNTLCNTLHHTATHCNTLQHTATHCNTLQHTATHYTTLQHTATHCTTLQHTATHCNTLHK